MLKHPDKEINLGLYVVVLANNFVYVGELSLVEYNNVQWASVSAARNIRVWGTSKGLGQLVVYGPTKDTVLDVAGTVFAPLTSVVHVLKCDAEAWRNK